MTTPRIFVSGQGGSHELNDKVYNRVLYEGVEGLLEPSVVHHGTTLDTFDGPIRINNTATHFDTREFELTTLMQGGNGRAESDRRMHDLFESIQGINTRFHVGSLFLDCNIMKRPTYSRIKEQTGYRDYKLACEAIPGVWGSTYAYAVGATQGVPVVDDRLARTDLAGTGFGATPRVFSINNPGSAPCRVALLMSVSGGDFTADKTIYIRNVDTRTIRRVAVLLDNTGTGTGIVYLPASAGFILMPGTNILRLENQNGTLETQADSTGVNMVWKLFVIADQTIIRYLGNDADKFNEGPGIFYHYRRGPAWYASSSTVYEKVENRSRLGSAFHAYTASTIGLVLEPAGTNLCLQSETFDNATWARIETTVTANATSAPDGTSNADSLLETAALGTTHSIEQTIGSLTANKVYVFSIFAKGNGRTWAMIRTTEGGVATNTNYNLSGAGSMGGQDSGASGRIAQHGTWYRLQFIRRVSTTSITFQIRIATDDSVTSYDGDVTKGLYLWGAQLERPVCTSYIGPTVAASASRTADHAALFIPHNYVKYSRDLSQIPTGTTDDGRWVRSHASNSVSRTQTADDGTSTANRLTFNANNEYFYQVITPDVKPNIGPWTVLLDLRKGLMTTGDQVTIQLESSTGSTLTSLAIADTDLSSSATRRFYASATALGIGSTTPGFRVAVKMTAGAVSTCKPDIEAIGLIRGTFPGPILHTEGSNVPLPKYGYAWPDSISQNGYIEVKGIMPAELDSDLQVIIGGNTEGNLVLRRPATAAPGQNFLVLVKNANDGFGVVSADINVGAIWEETLATFKIWWRNYTLSGTQTMTYGLDVNGVNKFTSSNVVSATITKWVNPERLWLSDGATILDMRNVTYGAYAPPANAVPADI